MSHSKQVFKNSLYLLNSQIIISVIGTIFLFITARLLKTQELAIVATFYILSGIISTLSQLGIPAIALREIPPLFAQNKITEVQRLLKAIFVYPTISALCLSALLLCFSQFISIKLLKNPTFSIQIILTIITVFISTIFNILTVLFQSLQRFKSLSTLLIVLNILQRISALGFYLIYEINGYIIGWGASIVIMVIIGLYLLRDYLFVSSGITPFRHVFGIALPYYLASYARYFFTQFDQLLIGFYFSPDILALYYICRRFTDFIWQIFQNTLDPLCAKIAELKINYLHKVSSAIQMSLTILSYVFVPIGMGLAASSYFALQLVTGGKYTVGYPILALLALSLIFYGYFNFFTLHVYILDQPKKRLYLEAILGGTQLIASCIGVYFGVIGIPLSLIISYTIGSLVAFWWVQRIIPFTVEYKNILKILLFGLIMAALLIFLQKIWYNTFIVPLYIVLVGAFFVVTSFKFLSKAEWEFVRNIIPEKIVRLLPIKRHL